MPGIGDLLFALSGQPNPTQQMAQMLNPQPLQPGASGPAQPSAAPSAPPPAQGPAPGQPPPPGSPPQPQAYQSSPDLAASFQQIAQPNNMMQLYMQMEQRRQAVDQMNRGFGIIAANHAGNPGMARAIMEDAMSSAGPDPSTTMGNLMSLYQGQRQMQVQQEMLQNADAYDAKLGLPPGTAHSMILSGQSDKLFAGMQPTEQQRNVQWEHNQFIQGGGTEEDWQTNYLPKIIMGGIPGMANPEMQSYNAAVSAFKAANPGQPLPPNLANPVVWKQGLEAQQQNLLEKQKDVTAGQAGMDQQLAPLKTIGGNVAKLQDAYDKGKLDNILKLGGPLIQSLAEGEFGTVTAALKKTGLSSLLPDWTPSDDDVNYAKMIVDLSKNQLDVVHSLGAIGARSAAPGFVTIGSKLGPLLSFAGKDQWGKNLGELNDAVQNGIANVYGSANQTPPTNDLKRRMNPIFSAGGDMSLRPAQALTPEDIQALIAQVKADPNPAARRADIIKVAKASNYDTTELERQLSQ